jgi:tRNA threonylcarbamoyladenosine modification (KEOPS) complex  Pcc1 subunit
MASTYTHLGIEKMATGENAGNWGTKTNTNLDIINESVAGYVSQAVTNGGTLTLTITDGAAGATAQQAIIKLTGSITGNSIVTVPDSIEKVWIVDNATTGAYTVQFKTVSGSGVTWGASDKGTKILYSDGTNVVDASVGGVGTYDLNGEELILDADADTSITADTDDQIDIKIGGTDQLTIKDGALSPVTNNDIDLGTASLEFKNAYFDGTVTSDAFAGPLTGNVTGNASGTAATVTGAAQTNITSLGTLTALVVDDIALDGKVVTMTGSASDTAILTAGTNGTLSIVTTDAAAAAANIQITADGTVDIDSAGVLTLDSGAAINIEPAVGSAILLDGTISVDAGVVTGATSITSTAFAGDLTGNVTGNASGTAATVTGAAQTNITSLGTLTALTVDNMVHNGDTITMTPSASDTATMTAATNGAFSLVTVDAAAAAANIQITADGTVDIDSAGVLTLDSGAAINIEPAVGSAILLDGTISVDAGVVTGATSITSTAFAGALTGNVTGNASGTAATVTTAAQPNITSLGTLTTLTVDNVIINGTTIGHTGDTDLMTVGSAILTVAGEVQMTTLDIGGTNVSATAAELNYSDLATLGTTAASKVITADANNLTTVSGAVANVEDTLTDGATITWDVIDSPVAKVTLAGNRTLSAPSGTTPIAGQFVSLLIIQDGTGSRTITWNAVYEFAADTAPTLTATASLGDLFTFRYNGAKWLEVGRNLALTLS